jgi:hypothetical protein
MLDDVEDLCAHSSSEFGCHDESYRLVTVKPYALKLEAGWAYKFIAHHDNPKPDI